MQASRYDEEKIRSLWPSFYPPREGVLGGVSDTGSGLLPASPVKEPVAEEPEKGSGEEAGTGEQPAYAIPDDGVSLIAPKNKCPYCDRRRVYHAKIAKKSRDKMKG
jgi:hypothetical protein